MNPSTSTRRPHAARNLIASKGGRDDIPNLNPSIIKRVRSLSEGCFILNNIKPSTFQALKYHYPELPEWNIRYDYDGLRESMTIKYIDSRIHDSVYVFFVRCIKEEIYQLERECCKQLQIKEFTKFTGFTGNYERRGSSMAPDAYIKVGAEVFPTIVMTVIWSDSMDDVVANAKMWLLGTGFVTKVVMIVHFTEQKTQDKTQDKMESGGEFSARNSQYRSNHYGHSGITATGIPTPDNKAGKCNSYLDEQILLASVSSTSDVNELSQKILALHQRQALSKPLIHPISAKLRVFRVHTGQVIYEEMTITILPELKRNSFQVYAISFSDLYGNHPLPRSVNPDGEIDFDLEELQEDLSDQISTIEKVRADARASAIIKARRP